MDYDVALRLAVRYFERELEPEATSFQIEDAAQRFLAELYCEH
jgi:hypothetical protein